MDDEAGPDAPSDSASRAAPEAADDGWCSYAEFGERFFGVVVTADRVAGSLADLAGRPLEIGPVGAGPGKIARVTVTGRIGRPTAVREDGEPLRFRLTLPMDIDLLIELPGQDNRFHGLVTVGLSLTAHAARPLRLVIDVEPPGPDDIEVDLVADGLRAGLLRAAAGIDEEIRKYVARYVERELESPRVRAAREIDIAGRIDEAWAARRP